MSKPNKNINTKCHHCLSLNYKKNGKYKGIQRFICKDCKRSFTSNEPKYSERIKEKAIMMYLNNVGIRKVALFLGTSPTTICKWIKKANKILINKLKERKKSNNKEPDIIEMDEIYTYIKKNKKDCSSGLLILENKVALLRL